MAMEISNFSNEAWLATVWLTGGGLLVLAFRGTGWLARVRFLRRAAVRPPKPFAGKVFVIDGDTISVRRTRVRLFGMDAPELTQWGGWKARSHLIRLAGGREVAVEPVDVDCYGRVVARVWLGSQDLSERMVRDGFARGISAWCTDYGAVEFEARRQRRGLWAAAGISDPAAHRRSKSVAPR
jgi:endonuclease YncB( thermonuclease family)